MKFIPSCRANYTSIYNRTSCKRGYNNCDFHLHRQVYLSIPPDSTSDLLVGEYSYKQALPHAGLSHPNMYNIIFFKYSTGFENCPGKIPANKHPLHRHRPLLKKYAVTWSRFGRYPKPAGRHDDRNRAKCKAAILDYWYCRVNIRMYLQYE